MPKVKVDINEYARSQPPKVREWIANVDKLMQDYGCHVSSSVVSNSKRTDGKFSYTSKKTMKTVCIINIGTSGCNIALRGNHFIHPNGTGNILDELPDDMFSAIRLHKKGPDHLCRNPDYSINLDHDCVHGVCGLYTYKGETFTTCLYGGFNYALNETTNFDVLTKWVALEAAFDGEIAQLQLPRRDKAHMSASDIQ